MLYFPTGVSLAYHTLSLPQGLLAFPWSLQGHYLLGFNLASLFSFASSGLAMSLLARSLSGSWLAGILAGTYFVLAPNYMVHVASAHLNLTSWQWALLACWAFLQLLSASRPWPWAAAFGLLAALSLYTDLLFGVFLAMLLPSLYLTARGLTLPPRGFPLHLLAGLGLAALLLMPLASGIVRGYPDVIASASWVATEERLAGNAPDLSYFVLPKGGTDGGLALYRELLPSPLVVPPKGSENRAFVGLFPGVLAFVGLLRSPFRWPLAALAILAIALSMGPSIHLMGAEISDNPVFHAFHALPGMAISRTPGRFLFVLTFAVALLAASALAPRTPDRLHQPSYGQPQIRQPTPGQEGYPS
jgi:hypothetical protein